MMFSEWFEENYPEGSFGSMAIMREVFREIALKAWLTSALNKEQKNPNWKWTDREVGALQTMMAEKEMSEGAVLRHAIRWLQYRDQMAKEGFPEVLFAARDGRIYKKPSKLPEQEG